MTSIDRRVAIIMAVAGAASLSSDRASAQADPARNKELLTRAYQRWHETKGGSVNEWMEIIDDNISFGSLAEGKAMAPFTARIQGKQQLKGYFAGLVGGWTMLHFTPANFIAEGDWVVMVGSTAWRNNATGKTFETPKVDVWRLRDARAVEFYEYYDTAGLAKAASPS
jgi:ketosteroid isomerase-like protein